MLESPFNEIEGLQPATILKTGYDMTQLSSCKTAFLQNTSSLFYLRVRVQSTRKVICDVLRNLVPFVQFKKSKHPWKSFTFNNVVGQSLQLS